MQGPLFKNLYNFKMVTTEHKLCIGCFLEWVPVRFHRLHNCEAGPGCVELMWLHLPFSPGTISSQCCLRLYFHRAVRLMSMFHSWSLYSNVAFSFRLISVLHTPYLFFSCNTLHYPSWNTLTHLSYLCVSPLLECNPWGHIFLSVLVIIVSLTPRTVPIIQWLLSKYLLKEWINEFKEYQ